MIFSKNRDLVRENFLGNYEAGYFYFDSAQRSCRTSLSVVQSTVHEGSRFHEGHYGMWSTPWSVKEAMNITQMKFYLIDSVTLDDDRLGDIILQTYHHDDFKHRGSLSTRYYVNDLHS